MPDKNLHTFHNLKKKQPYYISEYTLALKNLYYIS